MDLLNALERNEQSRARAALGRYVTLLESGSDDAKDVAELEACMAALGKSAADVKADLQAIRQARRLQQQIADGHDVGDAQDRALKACDRHREETDRIVANRKAEYQRLYAAMNEVNGRYTRSQAAGHELRDLKANHPELLGHVTDDPAAIAAAAAKSVGKSANVA